MHGSINVKFPNNTSKWQMEFNSAFKGLMNKISKRRKYLEGKIGIKMEIIIYTS
jgi:hypothetical protein